MRARDISASTRFFVGLSVLLIAVVATAVLGVIGLSAVDRANRQVFADNFRTSQETSLVATNLGRVEALSLEVIGAPNNRTAEGLRAQLEEIAIPRTTASIVALTRLHAGDPPAERAQIAHIPTAWRAFRTLAQTAPLVPGTGLRALVPARQRNRRSKIGWIR